MKTVIYLSISANGAITGFMPDMELHYGLLGELKADAILAGSVTARTGIEMFMQKVPAENPEDRKKPAAKAGDARPYWVLIDTKGSLMGLLHVFRQMGYCRDVIVLVSEKTPMEYLAYLAERGYDHHAVGPDRVDLHRAYALLAERYGVKTMVTDAGSILPSVLIEKDLADELHLLVAPTVVGSSGRTVFGELAGSARGLTLISAAQKKGGYVLLKYRIEKQGK